LVAQSKELTRSKAKSLLELVLFQYEIIPRNLPGLGVGEAQTDGAFAISSAQVSDGTAMGYWKTILVSGGQREIWLPRVRKVSSTTSRPNAVRLQFID
jgi:hypothetical protein